MNQLDLFPDWERDSDVRADGDLQAMRNARNEAKRRAAARKKCLKTLSKIKYKSEAAVKKAVRERDGYRCRDCGMSQEKHVEERGTSLHVHRVLADCVYSEYHCVTLCAKCHSKKKNREENDAIVLSWILYDPFDLQNVETLIAEAVEKKVSLPCLIDTIVCDYIRSRKVTGESLPCRQ